MQSFTPMSAIDVGGGGIFGIQRALETPYVVRTHACTQTCEEQSCFTFHHPTNQLESNERYICLEFPYDSSFGIGNGCGYGPFDPNLPTSNQHETDNQSWNKSKTSSGCTIHGFLGTFDATLYKSKYH